MDFESCCARQRRSTSPRSMGRATTMRHARMRRPGARTRAASTCSAGETDSWRHLRRSATGASCGSSIGSRAGPSCTRTRATARTGAASVRRNATEMPPWACGCRRSMKRCGSQTHHHHHRHKAHTDGSARVGRLRHALWSLLCDVGASSWSSVNRHTPHKRLI